MSSFFRNPYVLAISTMLASGAFWAAITITSADVRAVEAQVSAREAKEAAVKVDLRLSTHEVNSREQLAAMATMAEQMKSLSAKVDVVTSDVAKVKDDVATTKENVAGIKVLLQTRERSGRSADAGRDQP